MVIDESKDWFLWWIMFTFHSPTNVGAILDSTSLKSRTKVTTNLGEYHNHDILLMMADVLHQFMGAYKFALLLTGFRLVVHGFVLRLGKPQNAWKRLIWVEDSSACLGHLRQTHIPSHAGLDRYEQFPESWRNVSMLASFVRLYIL